MNVGAKFSIGRSVPKRLVAMVRAKIDTEMSFTAVVRNLPFKRNVPAELESMLNRG